jgi:hypothetical protein
VRYFGSSLDQKEAWSRSAATSVVAKVSYILKRINGNNVVIFNFILFYQIKIYFICIFFIR